MDGRWMDPQAQARTWRMGFRLTPGPSALALDMDLKGQDSGSSPAEVWPAARKEAGPKDKQTPAWALWAPDLKTERGCSRHSGRTWRPGADRALWERGCWAGRPGAGEGGRTVHLLQCPHRASVPCGQVSGTSWARGPKVLGRALAENHSLGPSRGGVRWPEEVQASARTPVSLCGEDPSESCGDLDVRPACSGW